MSAILRSLVSFFARASRYPDRHEYHQARLAVYTLSGLAASLSVFAAFYLFTAPLGSTTFFIMLLFNAPMVLVLLGMLFYIRSTGRYRVPVQTMLAGAWLGIVAGVWVTGGPYHSPSSFTLVVVPIIAYKILGLRSGHGWALLCLTTQIVLVAGHSLGFPYKPYAPEMSAVGQMVQLWFFVYVMAVGFSLLYAASTEQLREELDRERRRFEHMATHDPLTGLANRHLFGSALGRAVYHCHRYGSTVALMYIDLNGFKGINDTHGHDAGDAVLRSVARRLTDAIREGDTAGRLGGDEFAVVLEKVHVADLPVIARQLLDVLVQPIGWRDLQLEVGVSIGISHAPEQARHAEDLQHYADVAMYQAKSGDRDWCVYSPREYDRRRGLPADPEMP